MDSVPELTIDELRQGLEGDDPVTVLDIRRSGDREDWWIPDSRHLDVYEDMWKGEMSALRRGVEGWSREVPVVAVCEAGETSRIAARTLRDLGFEAYSLHGGMRAWSAAWNVAEVELPDAEPTILQVRRAGKGCLSYIIGSGDAAAVIDASVAPEVYERLAAERGWTIGAVLDTHIHADHVSRGRRLAERAGATYHVAANDRVEASFQPVRDGDEVQVSGASIRVMATPGHTDESVCYICGDRALASGDTLFLDGVGRPDLKASVEDARRRARRLYSSLRERVFSLPDDTVVLPGHTARPPSFDGRALVAALSDIRAEVELLELDRDEFVGAVIERIPPTPPNYEVIVGINEGRVPPPRDLTALEAGANRCAVS